MPYFSWETASALSKVTPSQCRQISLTTFSDTSGVANTQDVVAEGSEVVAEGSEVDDHAEDDAQVEDALENVVAANMGMWTLLVNKRQHAVQSI